MSRIGFLKLFTVFAVMPILMASCASTGKLDKSRGETLQQYENIIRWSQWDGAVNFIAPEFLEEHPISRLDLERLRLFRVTAYIIRSTQVYDEGMTMTQVVEIRLFHKTQAVERSVTDEQLWRYDNDTERWLLHSGLPDPTQRY
jgi:hypothetical protein